MMDKCPQPTALLTALDDGPDHQWRDHVAGCPACQALIQAREAFQDDALTDEPHRADEAAAAARLDTFVTGLPRQHQRRTYPTRLLGLAAVLLMGLGLFSLAPHINTLMSAGGLDTGSVGEVRLRADQSASSIAWTAPVVSTTATALVVNWQTYPTADRYQLIFLAPDLTEIASREVDQGTVFRCPTETIPTAAHGGFVVVRALANGQEIDRTRPAALP